MFVDQQRRANEKLLEEKVNGKPDMDFLVGFPTMDNKNK